MSDLQINDHAKKQLPAIVAAVPEEVTDVEAAERLLRVAVALGTTLAEGASGDVDLGTVTRLKAPTGVLVTIAVGPVRVLVGTRREIEQVVVLDPGAERRALLRRYRARERHREVEVLEAVDRPDLSNDQRERVLVALRATSMESLQSMLAPLDAAGFGDLTEAVAARWIAWHML